MRLLKMRMELDDRIFSMGVPIGENAKLIDYERALQVTSHAMLRLIKREYFDFLEKKDKKE